MANEKIVSIKELMHFTPKQVEATLTADAHKYTLFGGSAGPGKSYWLRWYMVRTLIKWGKEYNLNGIRAAMFCEDYPTLKDRQISKMEVEFPRWLGEIKDTKTDGLAFYIDKQFGGHVLMLRNLDDPSKYLSSEFAMIGVEELTQNEEMKFHRLRSRLRWTGIPEPKFIGATNPGGVGHCLPFGDVLTDKGWKDIKDIKIGEKVLTQDDDQNLIFVPVSQVTKEFFIGELLESKSNSAKFICTPNHKIARVTETKKQKGRVFYDISLVEVQKLSKVTRLPELGIWKGEEIKYFKVPEIKGRKLKIFQPDVITGDQFCELLGWFLSEGHTNTRDKAFSISQMKLQNRLIISKLLTDCGFKFCENKVGYTVYSNKWFRYFSQYGKCRDKFIPNNIKNTSPRQMILFWKAIMAGDGHGIHYYTTSKRLSEDMEEVGLKLSFKTYCFSRQRKNRFGLSYDISFKENRMGWIDKHQIIKKKYEGYVYCLGIDKLHRFFIRQNGHVWLSGNSWCRKYFIDKDFPANEMEGDKFAYVPALPTDNPHLAASYILTLQSLPERMRKAYLEGSWDIMEGQFFSEFNPNIHVCEPFEIPDTWPKIRGIDPSGRTGTTACYIMALSEDGTVYVIREHHKNGMDIDEHAREIVKMSEGIDIKYTIIDSSAFSKLGLPESMAEIFERYGVTDLIPADKKRIPGWNVFHQYLRPDPETGQPKMKIFRSCLNLIRTIPIALIDENDPEDVMSYWEGTEHQDSLDCIRYMCQTLREQVAPKPLGKMEKIFAEMKSKKQTFDYNYRGK